jgi:hypothetical protein
MDGCRTHTHTRLRWVRLTPEGTSPGAAIHQASFEYHTEASLAKSYRIAAEAGCANQGRVCEGALEQRHTGFDQIRTPKRYCVHTALDALNWHSKPST